MPFGPRRYLRKELLWPHLDACGDEVIRHLRRVGRLPDVVHSHYADAGYVGTRVSGVLGVPLVHTGHSLGRDKRKRLLAGGGEAGVLEAQYHFRERIDAEERTLDHAAFVIASTRQEVEEQYALYDSYRPTHMLVIPPGVNLDRFAPPRRGQPEPPVVRGLARFLREPRRPAILAIAHADERKNLAALVRAYGQSPRLREQANLVIVAGNRAEWSALDRGARRVHAELLQLIDEHDLYGRVAYPQRHWSEDVPDLYRWAASTHGVFVNPALTEPFGLTLLEAAASGLPVILTRNGGPVEILKNCRNGQLVDPADVGALGAALERALDDWTRWREWSRNGLKGVHAHYSWRAHATRYLRAIGRLTRHGRRAAPTTRSRLPLIDRLLVVDIDDTLLGDDAALRRLLARLGTPAAACTGFAVATGRHFRDALRVLREAGVPMPDIVISSVGTEIYYSTWDTPDLSWARHLDYCWQPDAVRAALDAYPGLTLQPAAQQGAHKISYYLDGGARTPTRAALARHLRRLGLQANVIVAKGRCVDILPIRGSKGMAVRYLGFKWGLPPERILVAGDSGNDEEMLRGGVLGVVVGNHTDELEHLRGHDRIHFAAGHQAAGILEGIDHYRFLDPDPALRPEPDA